MYIHVHCTIEAWPLAFAHDRLLGVRNVAPSKCQMSVSLSEITSDIRQLIDSQTNRENPLLQKTEMGENKLEMSRICF